MKNLLNQLPQTLNDHQTVIIQAPTGSGKTTRIPLMLLDHYLHSHQKILMLEPRRLAARSVARYMASLRGERVGESVGYRVKMDTQISDKTRLEVVTEGILLRMLQTDPSLEDYAIIIFDEFHERSVQADLGLALARQSQALFREDLQLIIMSATLNTEALAELLNAPILEAKGRQYAVETRHQAPPTRQVQRFSAAFVSQCIQEALLREPGSQLVFLPGSGEIRQVYDQLKNSDLPADTFVAPLYGSLSAREQDQAISAAPKGQRKIVLATNIAETSITIEGIRVVIDSGLERRPHFDANSGMTRLILGQIAFSSAEQRAGRAGRIEPGVCIRLWPAADNARMSPQQAPEILHSDLTPLALELARWGTPNPSELEWLTPPPAKAYEQAQALLQQLGALTPGAQITPHGEAMAELPITPRLAHMLLKAKKRGWGAFACYIAALLSERDILQQRRQSDLQQRLDALRKTPSAYRMIHQSAQHLSQHLKLKLDPKLLNALSTQAELGFLVGLAYPDRIAQHRTGKAPRFLLSGGRGALLSEQDALADHQYLAVADLDGHPREAKIYLAAALDRAQVEELTQDQQETSHRIDTETERVKLFKTLRYGALILKETRIKNPDPEQLQMALCQMLSQQGIHKLPWSTEQKQWLARLAFAHRQTPDDWPDLDMQTLAQTVNEWLGPFLTGRQAISEIQTETLQQALDYLLGYEKSGKLKTLVPTHIQVASGTQVRLDYTQGDLPVLAVRLQEVFGLQDTPKIYKDQVMLMMHLLSPARRPIQVTQDLQSFWKNTYHEVKKELKGRYPKHYWPENPLEAEPTARIKPRKR